VIGFGTVDDWYGEVYYGADGIAYFDNANAIRSGNWVMALSPYWSIGYPLALTSMRWMFPAGWAGEWTSIHVVNMIIYAATYASFLYFLRQAIAFAARTGGSEDELPKGSRALFIVGSFIFVGWQVQTQDVSRTTPDLMVSGLFFLLTAFALQFCLRPSARPAFLMGFVAGLGYVAKAAFLPISFFVFFAVLVRVITQPGSDRFRAVRKFFWAAPAMALPALPYVIAISLVLGRFTLGESGSLNYAWTVNKLPHWHWTGGTPAFGAPIHPVRLLSTAPHVYEFAEPFHVTYPPFYNPYYWYEGYRHFFNLHNEIEAIKPNLFILTTTFFSTPHAPTKFVLALAAFIVLATLFTKRAVYWKRVLALWPLYVPTLLGIAMYIAVCLEVRYVLSFLIVLMITPLLPLFVPSPVVGKKTGYLILALASFLSLGYMIKDLSPALGRVFRHDSFTTHEEWRVGLYLAQQYPTPGTKVAMVRIEHGIQTTWAYVAGLHIVGAIGSQDFDNEQQTKDFDLFTKSPEVQQTVFDLFRKAGAVVVVAMAVPDAPSGDGWVQVPGTKAWVHPL
jgi:hypothetical protein